MDQLGNFKGNRGFDNRDWNTREDDGLKQKTGCQEKKALVAEEITRMNKLPATSSYATHRLRVLNKILDLLSIQRTLSQDQELELLFSGLSI